MILASAVRKTEEYSHAAKTIMNASIRQPDQSADRISQACQTLTVLSSRAISASGGAMWACRKEADCVTSHSQQGSSPRCATIVPIEFCDQSDLAVRVLAEFLNVGIARAAGPPVDNGVRVDTAR